MIYIVLGAAVLAVLVWAGRRANLPVNIARWFVAALGLAAAAASIFVGLRGQWIGSLALFILALYMAQAARAPRIGPPNYSSEMSLSQARSILGVGPEATRPDIEAAYRRLMRQAHPDKGGTTGLAAQLNAARDRLLG